MNQLNQKQIDAIKAMQPLLKSAHWLMRVTERKEFTGPVLEICERYKTEKNTERLREYGRIYNGSLRACKAPLKVMLSQVTDDAGIALGIQELIDNTIEYRGQVPLGEIVGPKLALLSKLHPTVHNTDRLELMAWRIERFSIEETLYWLSKVSVPTYGKRSIEWAKSGLRMMLAGRSYDQKEVAKLLEVLRK